MIKNNKGFTFVEMMIASAIIGIMGAMTSTFYMLVYKSYAKIDAQAKNSAIVIHTLNSMQKELRQIAQAPTMTAMTNVHPTTASPVAFYIPSLTDPFTRSSDDKIEYYIGTYNGKTGRLLQRLTRGATVYSAVPVIMDFDVYRNTPTTYPQSGGLMPNFNNSDFRYDDFNIFYDNTYNVIKVGITASTADKSKSGTRKTLTLTTSVTIRNTF
ncbi:MAG: prepilin-type N-terminal cleavage/methylation domain-containing protein [Candidatus Firestonebacteria bacterium]